MKTQKSSDDYFNMKRGRQTLNVNIGLSLLLFYRVSGS